MATYFGNKRPYKYRKASGPLRPPTPVINPMPALNDPRSRNLSQRVPQKGPRLSNVLDGRTGQLMPLRDGRSVPLVNPLNRSPSEVNAVARAAARRLGLAVRNINPVLRFAQPVLDIYDGLKDEPFYKFGPDSDPVPPYSWPGWQLYQTCVYPDNCYMGPLSIDLARTCSRLSGNPAPVQPAPNASQFSLTAEYKFNDRGNCRYNSLGRRSVFFRYIRIAGSTIPVPTSIPGPVRAPVGIIPVSIPSPAAITEDVPGRDPSPYELPVPRYAIPSVDIDIAPGSGGHIPPRNGIHVRRKPRPNEREKKRGIPYPKVLGAIAALYDATTEAQEIVDIFYDRLGKKCRGAKSMSEKAYCVYANLDTLDIDGAVGDLILNHYEDKAWGKFHSYAKNAPFGVSLTGGKPYYSIEIPQ